MKRNELAKLNTFKEPDEKLLFSKVLDRAGFCLTNHEASFTSFHDPLRCSKYMSIFYKAGIFELNVLQYGGFIDAERCIIGFGFSELACEDFPIDNVLLSFDTRFVKTPTHRDILGSVLGLGLERQKVGDIILSGSDANVFLDRDISNYVIHNLKKVGKNPVKSAIIINKEFLMPLAETREETIIVSSLRIDTVLAHSFNISRGKAAEYINGEVVFVNWIIITNISKTIEEGDTITFRGKGRIKVLELSGKTKKDNYILKISRSV